MLEELNLLESLLCSGFGLIRASEVLTTVRNDFEAAGSLLDHDVASDVLIVGS